MSLKEKNLGYIQVIFSGVCFGFLGFFGKTGYQYGFTPGELLALRYSTAAVLLGIYLLIADHSFLKMTLKEKIISTLLGVCGYALFSSLFFYALKGISASLTVLLLYTYPVMVAFLSLYFFKEKITKELWGILTLATAGLYLLLRVEWDVKNITAIIFGFGAAFFYSLYILYSRKYVAHLKASASSFYVQLGAGFILSAIHFKDIERPLYLFQHHGLFILAMALVCSLLAMTLFLAGLQKLTATETSILSTTEPLFGVLIAILLLNEKFYLSQFVGAFLVLIALIWVALKKNDQAKS